MNTDFFSLLFLHFFSTFIFGNFLRRTLRTLRCLPEGYNVPSRFLINSVFFSTLNTLKKTDEIPKALYENVKGEQERLVNFSSVYKWSNLFLHDFNVSFVLWICSTNNVADWSLSFQSQRSWLSVHLEGSCSICSHHTRLSLNEAASMFICSQVWRQTLHMLSLQVSIPLPPPPQFVFISVLSFVFHWRNEPFMNLLTKKVL